MTATRAIREFPYASDPWLVVESWAAHNRYHVVERAQTSRLFRKHKGWISVPTMVSILAFDGRLHLEAWLGAAKITGASAGASSELTIEPDGVYATVPRRRARAEVNELLAALGAPAITDAADPDDQLSTAVQLGVARATQLHGSGDYAGAVAAWEETLPRAERRFGRLHGITLTATLDLATAMLEAGRTAEAVDDLRRLVPQLDAVIGPAEPWTVNAKEALAVALAATGREDEARALAQRTLADVERAHGSDHLVTLDVKERLDRRDWRTGLPSER